jgi:TetR/AcrR family transcriptional regulator, tetracycline repressor protein
VDAACQLATEVGLRGLSMPRVARRIEASAASVYWYFRTKDELMRAIADRVTTDFCAGLDDDDDGLEGEDRILAYFRVLWQRLRENPLWREVFITSFTSTLRYSDAAWRRAMQVHEAEVARIMETGMTVAEATRAHTVLSAFTRGYVLVEHLSENDIHGAHALRSAPLYPGFESYAKIQQAVAESSADETFETGLRALWRGLVGQTAAGRHDSPSVRSGLKTARTDRPGNPPGERGTSHPGRPEATIRRTR